MAFAWISSLSIASILGIVTGFFLGKYSQAAAEKKPCEETKEIEEKKEVTMEVIFFPDTITQAGDASLSREMKGMLYKEILNQSEPLKRLVAHISSAKVSLDLCLYIMTCHKLGKAVIKRMQEGNIRVRLIVDDNMAKDGGSFVGELQRHGAFVKVMKKSDYLMHHKFAIVDGIKIATGSFNWTMQAVMGNYENVIITDHSHAVNSFKMEFEKLWSLTK